MYYVAYFFLSNISKANEPFTFNVTEIEILQNGNKIYGYKGGTATSIDGSIITAENFFYNKLTNILQGSCKNSRPIKQVGAQSWYNKMGLKENKTSRSQK